MRRFLALISALCTVLVPARGVHASHARRQDGFSTLSAAEIAAFKPYTFYASAAYCPRALASIMDWNCGANCEANPTFVPVASGGNGDYIPFWYVGYDPELETVIVGHEGTDAERLQGVLTDMSFVPEPLHQYFFPGRPLSVRVHSGFAEAHAFTAKDILVAVRRALDQSKLKKVTVVGHGLGAAIALLDAICLSLYIPDLTVRVVGYGMPRVGNQAFATYADAHISLIDRVNNKEDIIPISPGTFLGYHHPRGEKHIQDSGAWISCPGQDNTDQRCTTGDVPDVFQGNIGDHDGPYDGVIIGC